MSNTVTETEYVNQETGETEKKQVVDPAKENILDKVEAFFHKVKNSPKTGKVVKTGLTICGVAAFAGVCAYVYKQGVASTTEIIKAVTDEVAQETVENAAENVVETVEF